MSDLHVQRDATIDRILDESDATDDDFTWDEEIAAKCIRAAYAQGYHDGLADEQPFPLTVASRAEREAWARLPV